MFIDLSVSINEQTPVYPGDPKTKIKPAAKWASNTYRDHYVSIGTHAGTHVDAPWHMVKDGITLDKIPVEQFTGRGVCVQINGQFDLATVKKADVQPNDIVLFYTGMSKVYDKSEYYDNYPSINNEVAKYLVKQKVKMVGVDMCSVDKPPFLIHRVLLGANILIIENLTNLEELVNKNFTVYAFPIKLQIDGAPVRVIAKL
jgi:arylformamidase